MNVSAMFRYLDKKYYKQYSSFLEFVQQYPFKEEEINTLDEFGYNLLHYCAMKSNIVTKCTEVLLDLSGKMYITSENEGLTPFEIALRKRNIELMKLYFSKGYDIHKEDEFGFSLLDKLGDDLFSNYDFYLDVIHLLEGQGLKIERKTTEKPMPETIETKSETASKSIKHLSTVEDYLKKNDFKAVSIHLRTEMENKFFEKLLVKVGKDLQPIINNRSLNDLIYDLFNLNLISYDEKEFYITAKNICNYYCHRGDSKNQLVNEFIYKTKDKQKLYFIELENLLKKM